MRIKRHGNRAGLAGNLALAMGLAVGLTSALVTGCATEATDRTIDEHAVLTGSLQSGESSLSGSGSVVFNAPLSGAASKQSYNLSFTLADGGSLALHSNASNQLENAIAVEFTRSGTALAVKLKKTGASDVTVSSSFSSIDASGTISIVIDVHNDEAPAHLLAWTGSSYAESAAIFNSEDSGNNAPGQGAGQYWGLVLSNATVSRANVGTAKFVE